MTVRKICILGLDDYPMLSGKSGYIGGESVQHLLLARAWRDMGLDVSVIVFDEGQPRDQVVDGIRAIPAFRRHAGVPGLRFFHPRISRVVWAMRQADADVYYQSPASPFTGVTAWFAKHYRKCSLVRVASDLGCIPGKQLIRLARDRKLYDYGLRNASLIAAQTRQQQTLLKQHYGLASQIVNMAVEVPVQPDGAAKDIDVLWVGNMRPVKRPEVMLELARRLPDRNFVVVGGPVPGQGEYYAAICQAAQALPNVTLLGALPYDAAAALFARARLHVNTSEIEGFPNTFLQAWIRGVPVVTFFDPDQLVRKRQLGHAAADVEDMAHAVQSLLADEARRRDMGAHARAFAMAEFLPSKVAARYLELLDELGGYEAYAAGPRLSATGGSD